MKNIKKFELPLILFGYVLFYFLYRLFGLDFQYLCRPWYLLDHTWLHDNLLKSLWYLHAQPPVSNLFLGLLLKASPVYYGILWEVIHLFVGIAGIWFFFNTLVKLNIGTLSRVAVCSFLCIFPTMALYQSQTISSFTHIEFCFCAISLYYLIEFYSQYKKSSLIKMFSAFVVLSFIRPQWHLAVFVLITMLIIILEQERTIRKRIALLSLIFIIPIVALYAKNKVMYGFFGASSWMGGNVAQVAQRIVVTYMPLSELSDLQNEGKISKDFACSFSTIKVPKRIPRETLPKVLPDISLEPYFNGHNGDSQYFSFNYLGMIESASQDMKDSIVIIKKHPFRYVQVVICRMWEVIWTPCSWQGVHSFQLFGYKPLLSILSLLYVGSFIFYVVVPLIVLFMVIKYPSLFTFETRKFIVVTFVFALIMFGISCACNGTEQERMRWAQVPIYLCHAAVLLNVFRNKFLTNTK